jgi:hypothetical protein
LTDGFFGIKSTLSGRGGRKKQICGAVRFRFAQRLVARFARRQDGYVYVCIFCFSVME